MKILKITAVLFACLMLLQLSCSHQEQPVVEGDAPMPTSKLLAPDSWVRSQPEPIVVYGDSRTGHDTHRRIVAGIMEMDPVAVFHTGDLVGDGRRQDHWDIFNDIVADMVATTEFYPCLGNHEYNSSLYFDNFELPGNERWFSVDRAGIHFIILDSNWDMTVGSEQYEWLVANLQNMGDSIMFVAAVFHHPPYSTGRHAEDEMGLRGTIVPLFEQYDVDIVFNGHDHDYERTFHEGIYYIVTGGGGAPLRDQYRTSPESQVFIKINHFCRLLVSDNRLIVDVFDVDLNVIDRFIVNSSRPQLEPSSEPSTVGDVSFDSAQSVLDEGVL
jgi:hypothetical protein